jgi:GTP-binding protein Era
MNPSETSAPLPEAAFRCGLVAIVGRPNVGKSTLMNRLVGEKVSITSRKAQTTRHRIHGVLTQDDAQYVFVDTPGFQTRHANALNRVMNRNVTQALADVDVVALVVEAGKFSAADRAVLKLLPAGVPVVLVVNKIDHLASRDALLPLIESLAAEAEFAEIVPLSAENGLGCDELLRALRSYLPANAPMFAEDDVTDRSLRFLAAEYIREKLFRRLGEELPYGLTVEIERFEEEAGLTRIAAAIIVDKAGHKGIVIGKGGTLLKQVGSDARRDLERLLGTRVFLELWVKVKSGWADDERALKSLGYE